MFFARLKAASRSLRFRLMLWNAAAGLITALGVLLAVREGVRYALLSDLDQVLWEDLQEIELHFRAPDGYNWANIRDEMNLKAHGHDIRGWFVQFYDRAGQPSWSSYNAPELPALQREERVPRHFNFEGHRLAFRPLPQVAEVAGVSVGCNRRFLTREMASIDRMVLIVGGCVVLIAPIGGYLLAGRTTRILSNLTQTAAKLRPSALHDRLPVRGAGDELDALAMTINGLLDRLGEYLQQRQDFLANAAHELRTPLAAIRSSIDVGLSGERSAEQYRELLDEVIEQCLALQVLVNQLLLLAESDAERIVVDLTPVPLDRLVQRSVDMFQGVAEEAGIELVLRSTPVSVPASAHHLHQVLNNLLENAIKFTAARFNGRPSLQETGRIEVQLSVDAAARQASISIVDNGIGISKEDLPRVFERFFRCDRSRPRDARHGGTGLGLSICQAIVTAHHGTISVHSELGRGSCFRVVLPTCQKL